MAESLMDIKISYEFSQRRSGDPASLVAKSNKAREVLGWSPKFGLKEILQTTIDSIV
jgi:UDP-glucose 4-epimerase